MAAIEVGALGSEDELQSLASLLGWSFGFPAADAVALAERAGRQHLRVARSRGALVGCLLQIPMGQWFGGRSVPMLGLAGVAVAPEARGQKVALTLVVETLREARAAGFALSTLYPATVTLYRAAGYELAGTRLRFSAECGALPIVRTDLALRAIEPGDTSLVEELYARVASRRTGYLDRGPYVWGRVREARGEPVHGYLALAGARAEGYVYVSQKGARFERELVVHDLVAESKRATERLLAFLADHRSTLKHLTWHGTSADALALSLPERVFRAEVAEYFMLRLLDVGRALALRGYPDLDAEIDFEITDAVLAENAGRYRLRVSGGKAEVTSGGSGGVKLDVRALAALYSGFLSPFELERAGAIVADERSLGRLAGLFAGPPPSLADFF